MHPYSSTVTAVPRRQSGAVLPMGLVMVLLMTVIAMASIRGSGLQETMAGNMRERNIAFQTAEAGLRAGENFVEENVLDVLSVGTVPGYFSDLSADAARDPVSLWTEEDWAGDAVEVDFDLPDVAEQPRYLVERLEVSPQQIARMLGHEASVGGGNGSLPEPQFYRVSSRGLDRTGMSETVLQSLFIRN